jgi:peptidoglycan hydrolase CwlO-like protein
MSSALVPIIVAVIGGPIMWFLSRFDRRNTNQHNQNIVILKRVESKVDRLDEKSDHLDAKVGRIDEKVDDVSGRVTQLESKKTAKRTPKTE